jgi:hypothetical protein
MRLVRTFWEKATLIHFEIAGNDRGAPAERHARHWYDLHALSHRVTGRYASKRMHS